MILIAGLWIYQFGFGVFGFLYLLIRTMRGRPMPGLRERLAIYSSAQKEQLKKLRRPLWMQLVSVGEVVAAQPLILRMKERFPDSDWVVTTVTPAGRAVAEKNLAPLGVCVLYLPWDFQPITARAIRIIRPALFLSFETELWPVLYYQLEKAGVPVAVVNGRISARAYPRYLWVRFWMERFLHPVQLVLAQTPQDARRYAALGAAKDRIGIAGNIKWDLPVPAPVDSAEQARRRKLLGVSVQDCLWIAGSTHPGEEEIILRVYRRLRESFPGLRLALAPRHTDRTETIGQLVEKEGLRWVRKTALKDSSPVSAGTVVLVDTVGELTALYQISDLVFVGGSLVPKGGHNLIEPAVFSKPIMTGPFLQNFQAIAEALRAGGGLAVVSGETELEKTIRNLISMPGQAGELGERAYSVYRGNQGAVDRICDAIARHWGSKLSK